MLLFVARPTKKQLAASKDAKRLARKAERLERGYHLTPLLSLCVLAVVTCESCGVEQTTPTTDGVFIETLDADPWYVLPCIVCGHDIAATSPRHEEFLREAAEQRDELLAAA